MVKNSENKGLIIAIDGYSSTGKSTIAKLIASRLEYIYIDTGAMYRAVTLFAIRNGYIHDKEVDNSALEESINNVSIDFRYNRDKRRNDTYLNGEEVEEEIREMEVSSHVSMIASIAFVREYLVKQQREMGKKGGVVMDGRDIGSVVFPDADIKFFLTSDPKVRAARRYKELKEKGSGVTFEEVEENVRSRDFQDENREESPLKRVDDAVLVDNSDMTIEEELDFMLQKIERIAGQYGK